MGTRRGSNRSSRSRTAISPFNRRGSEIGCRWRSRCPKMPRRLLPPLLENAVHHGVAIRREGGCIRIAAALRNGLLEIVIQDNGDGLSGEDPVGHGIGLSNTRARLDAMYGGRARLDVRPAAGGGTAVTVTLPAASS